MTLGTRSYMFSQFYLSLFRYLLLESPSYLRKYKENDYGFSKFWSALPSYILHVRLKKKGRAIPVTGRGSPYGCETSRLPHFLDNQLTDYGEVVSLTRLPPITPRKIPGTHFCQRLSQPQGHTAARWIRSIEKSNGLIRNRIRDLPACSIAPQPTTLPGAPLTNYRKNEKIRRRGALQFR
jgi:hypothetical protein